MSAKSPAKQMVWVGRLGRLARLVAVLAVVTSCAGSGPEIKPEQWRARLRAGMAEDVPTREKRGELSRLLVDATDHGALDRLERPDVSAALGKPLSCDSLPLCAEQGFLGSDWYYLMGHTENAKIKQLPLLIVGFDPQDRVSRVYVLHTD